MCGLDAPVGFRVCARGFGVPMLDGLGDLRSVSGLTFDTRGIFTEPRRETRTGVTVALLP